MWKTFVITAVFLLSVSSVLADEQTILGEGDEQACIGNGFFCGLLASEGSSGDAQVTAIATSIESTYTLNDIVLLGPSWINNTGNGTSIGQLVLTVEQNVSGSWTQVAVIHNDTANETNRTISAGDALDVAAVWNAAPWNTTLAGVDTYRLHVRYYDTNGTILTEAAAGISIVNQLLSPIITAPVNNSLIREKNATIAYNVTGYRQNANCSILIDDVVQNTSVQVNTSGPNSIAAINLTAGVRNATIACIDDGAHTTSSQTIVLRVIPSSNFTGQTTDFNSVNLSNITNLTLDSPSAGKIVFGEDIDLSAGIDLNEHVIIAHNFISIDSVGAAALNKSATLTFTDIAEFTHPAVYRDGEACTDCSLLSVIGNNVTVFVPHFSSYVVGANSRLAISDTSDSQSVYATQQVTFYANYTNVTSGAPIIGATCNITVNGTGPVSMIYNATLQRYTYNQSFPAANVYPFTIACNATGFEALNTTDYSSVSAATGPTGAVNITVVQSSRGPENQTPSEVDARGGNTSEINFNTLQITGAWQGTYGNLTGQIVLGGNATFYNWSLRNAKGEIYASRANDVNFATIGCAPNASITGEDTFLGTTGRDDAVNRTFAQYNHPGFATGIVSITNNSCRSTNLYTNTGPQADQYHQVLLTDGANNTVYTALLNNGSLGFDGAAHDFEMLLPTRQSTIETFYYWVEIT